jgi:preprotein translocase subunit SecE
MNRQTKRMMQRQGADKPRTSEQRRQQAAPVGREKVGPREYLSEVKAELRKVAWPTRKEVINSTIIVLIAVVVMTTLIFGFDYVSSKFVLFLFD